MQGKVVYVPLQLDTRYFLIAFAMEAHPD